MTLLPVVPVFDGWVMTAEWLARLTQQWLADVPLGHLDPCSWHPAHVAQN